MLHLRHRPRPFRSIEFHSQHEAGAADVDNCGTFRLERESVDARARPAGLCGEDLREPPRRRARVDAGPHVLQYTLFFKYVERRDSGARDGVASRWLPARLPGRRVALLPHGGLRSVSTSVMWASVLRRPPVCVNARRRVSPRSHPFYPPQHAKFASARRLSTAPAPAEATHETEPHKTTHRGAPSASAPVVSSTPRRAGRNQRSGREGPNRSKKPRPPPTRGRAP